MKMRTLGLAALLASSLYQHSNAVVRPKGAEAPIVSSDQGGRAFRTTKWVKPGQLANRGLGGWTAIWDHDTDVPLRMWGEGIFVAGSVADAAVAESAARLFLSQYLATLAPGASPSDFQLVSNQLDGDIRSVGFAQHSNGVRVLGGSIGFAFKRDRLALVSSTALPHVNVIAPMQRLAPAAVQRAATRWLADDGHAVAAKVVSGLTATPPVILPVVRPRIGAKVSITYRVAEQVAVEANAGVGRWNVWLDATDGSPIARKSTIHWGSGRVLFDVPDRGPHSTRSPKPAAFARHNVDSILTTATADGTVTWAGAAAASVQVKITGPFASVINKGGSATITDAVTLPDGGDVTISHPTIEFADAQLNAFVHANIAKQFAKSRLNPTLGWLDDVIPVHVNEDDTCNAFSTGDDIHFFRTSNQCQNTGRLADVVYHEFGHSLHANSIVDGVGQFDGALSEGISDSLAMAITGDPGMGRGFFHTNAPLRNLENNKRWPDDVVGQIHSDGEIIGATNWHLRVALEAKLGTEAGYAQFLKILYSQFQRAADIPSTYAEALLADDDDGNLANGTPNQCDINAVFGAHGLADPTLTLGITNPVRDELHVSVTTASAATACPGSATITGAVLDWKLRGGVAAPIPMTVDADVYSADIPPAPEGSVVNYRVTFTLSDGSKVSYPQNPADPFYEMYVGPVTVLQCFDFESAQGADDWTKTPDWQVGAPQGLATDPKVAFAGTGVFGLDLMNDGAYRSNNQSVAESPEIDLQGNRFVRLQYQRWLGVEDGFFDTARILANGNVVFGNFKSPNEPQSGVNHIDREWRFHDVDLSSVTDTGKLKFSFILESDQGLEFGGWTVDDVCVVAYSGIGATCGNTTTDEGEQCDDGNRVDGDGCSANCQSEGDADTGCCSVGGGPEGALALSAFTFGLLFVRRRRRA